jgi:hypothetical protein
MTSHAIPCQCCGHLTISERGGYEICPVCFWEDDGVQARYPDLAGGANKVSLIEAQANYRRIGACEEQMLKHVRPPRSDEPVATDWRPIMPGDAFESWADRPASAHGYFDAVGESDDLRD